MPKYSKSRSRSRDRKREHRHKDKKKHRKHSRSVERKERDYKKDDSYRERRHHDSYDNGRGREQVSEQPRNGRNFHQPSTDDRNGHREEQKTKSQEKNYDQQQALKKSSRFSDQPTAPSDSNQQQNAAMSRMQMPPPNQIPQKRKKFVWTDADENEMRDQYKRQQDDTSPALMLGSNLNSLKGLSPAILNALQDSSKIKKKIYLPKNTGVNYIGLLIGPRGLYQKRLEEESGCKILIRGKGSQKEGSAPQPDDDDEQHVLVIGDSADSVRRAQNAIERVISADDSTRNKIREEQLNVAQQINDQVMPNSQMDDSMMTPYGPPSPYAYIIPVPNDCVGLIIGKGGDTIRQLQMESGAKIQVAKKEIPNSNLRNVFVEGVPDKYQRAKEMIDEIIREHRRTADPQIHVGDVNPFSGPHHKISVPDKFVGLIIGKNGENLRGVAQRSNTKLFVPQKNNDPTSEERIIEADGDLQNVEIARQEVFSLIQRYMSQSGSANFDYSKNPYGSGIAVYNQQKLASDGQAINGAVPDSLKPDSGSYASNLLTENPMIAYASMQLTGWSGSYDDPNPSQAQIEQPDGKYHQNNFIGNYPQDGRQDQHYAQEGHDYGYQNYYGQGMPPATYDPQQYPPTYDQQQYYQQYYGQPYPQPTDQAQGTDQQLPQTTEGQAQPSTDTQGENQQLPTGDYQQQYNQDYYAQYYAYYGQYPPGTADQAGYYQQPQGTYEQQPGTETNPEQVQAQDEKKETEQPNQQPGQ